MSHFLALPRELRDIIYEYCLVVGKVFPYYEGVKDPRHLKALQFQRPQTGLLKVSKQLHQETEQMLYAKNMFVIPFGDNNIMNLINSLKFSATDHLGTYRSNPKHLVSQPKQKKYKYIRGADEWIASVEFSLESFDISKKKFRQIVKSCALPEDFPAHLRFMYVLETGFHDRLDKELASAWFNKFEQISRGLPFLKDLHVRMGNSFCVFGCHDRTGLAAQVSDWIVVLSHMNNLKPTLIFRDAEQAKLAEGFLRYSRP